MVDYVPSNNLGAEKRRSTRIVQAVPVTVTGVDALGQPFKERTSTLTLNCHGCKYPSKHYVSKNAWVTLEIPHPETGRPPRCVRARVTWIHRPRTVRELFQVSVELESPGNVWGIAFPPQDWFSVQEPSAAEIQAVAGEPPASPEATPPPAEPAAEEDKVRAFPVPGPAEASAALAGQMQQLLTEARQQVEKTIREATAAAIAAETSHLLGELSAQLQGAAGKAVEAAAASYVDQVVRHAAVKIDEARHAAIGALREDWAQEFERAVHESSQHLVARLTEVGEAFRENFGKQLEADVCQALERVEKLNGEIGSSAEAAQARLAHLRKKMDDDAEAVRKRWQGRLDSQTEEAFVRLRELEQAARKLNEKIAAATQQAHADWREKLDSELAVASNRWNEQLQASLDGAAERLASQLAQFAETTTARREQELTARVAALQQSFEQTATEAQQTLGTLRAALEQDLLRSKAWLSAIQQATTRLEEDSARFEAFHRSAAEELDRRFKAILAAQSAELNQRVESSLAGLADRLQPVLAGAEQQSLARFVAQVEQQLAPQLKRAQQAAQQLAASQESAEETVRAHRERLRQDSQQSAEESVVRMRETIAELLKEFDDRSHESLGKLLEELEAKSTEASHATFETLYKSSEWYQKKAQTSMQAAVEKALEQAGTALREKAAEISSLFASELDHYSRSYVEQTQGLLDENAKELVGRTRDQLDQAAETTAASFGDHVHQIAEHTVARFTEASHTTLEQTTAELEARATQARSQMEAHAEQSFRQFQHRLADQMERDITEARKDFGSQLTAMMETGRAQQGAQQREWLEKLAQRTSEAVEQYKQRLENVSNTWIVASVTTLSERGQSALDTLAKAAEQRLRETCSQVFAGMAETMRQRLLSLSSDLQAATTPREKE